MIEDEGGGATSLQQRSHHPQVAAVPVRPGVRQQVADPDCQEEHRVQLDEDWRLRRCDAEGARQPFGAEEQREADRDVVHTGEQRDNGQAGERTPIW
jgi:hypothetical protein